MGISSIWSNVLINYWLKLIFFKESFWQTQGKSNYGNKNEPKRKTFEFPKCMTWKYLIIHNKMHIITHTQSCLSI